MRDEAWLKAKEARVRRMIKEGEEALEKERSEERRVGKECRL